MTEDVAALIPDCEVDARGMKCPMPLLKAKQALLGLNLGGIVAVMASDPGSVRDFHSFVSLTSHELLRFSEIDGTYHYLIRKG